jgi:CheY-like chemotaxis protein
MADKQTILIVDDEPDTLTYFSSLLEDHGFATVTAENGAEAIARVKESPPDLVTLDITMPETSGVRCYRELRGHDVWRHIPVIVVTGISEDFRTFISSRKHVPPPDGYLAKPVDGAELLDLVRKLLSAREPAVPGKEA